MRFELFKKKFYAKKNHVKINVLNIWQIYILFNSQNKRQSSALQKVYAFTSLLMIYLLDCNTLRLHYCIQNNLFTCYFIFLKKTFFVFLDNDFTCFILYFCMQDKWVYLFTLCIFVFKIMSFPVIDRFMVEEVELIVGIMYKNWTPYDKNRTRFKHSVSVMVIILNGRTRNKGWLLA